MKVLAFAATNSTKSINKQLLGYAKQLMENEVAIGSEVELIDLNDYEMPIFSEDREAESGIPQLAQDFTDNIANADALIIAFAEHNSNFSAAFKNVLDWASRVNYRVYQNKPMVMLATSPGKRGGANVLELALNTAPRFTGDVKGSLSVPSFGENFDTEQGRLVNPEIDQQLKDVLAKLKAD